MLAALLVGACAPVATPSSSPAPATVAALRTPAPTPSLAPTPSPTPYWTGGWPAEATLPPWPTPRPARPPATGAAGRPTRVAVPAYDVDLPVVVPPKRSTWPLCDVAEFFAPPLFSHPGAGGVTYIYAHAQEGMFLPLLTASRRNNGKRMIGRTVAVWTARNHRYLYKITQVRRGQKSLDWAFRLPPNSLVLQTSEDQYRTGTKLMLVARQVGTPTLAPRAEARPKARPRVCGR